MNNELQQWEYDRWFFHPEDEIIANLNNMGSVGWELVSVIQVQNGDGAHYIFKRPKTQPQ